MVAILQKSNAPTQAEFHAAIAARSDRWYSACLRITRNPDIAQDAVQDALLSAWNKRHQFDQSARLETWIHRIAVNAALQLLRRHKPERHEALHDEVADQTMRPDKILTEYQLDDQLSGAMNGLSDFERICFVLKHLEQWRLKEIAGELDENVGAVKQAVFRSVRKLRIRMADLQETDNE